MNAADTPRSRLTSRVFKRRIFTRLARVAGALTVAVALIIGAAQGSTPAYAVDYPSWSDVQAAQASEAGKQAEISRIQTLIAGLASETAAAQALAEQRGNEYQEAQSKFDTATVQAAQLKTDAEAKQAKADASIKQAGQLAAMMARSGGGALSVNLLVSDSSEAQALLYQLGAMSQLTGSSSRIYAVAERDSNDAGLATEQANVAAEALGALAAAAEVQRQQAIEAQQALEVSLAAQQDNQVTLETQLAVLSQNRAATADDYQAGVDARAAQAAAEAAAAAAAAAAAQASGGGGGSSAPNSGGWANPLPGSYSSDEFGMRVNPVDGGLRLHAGIDLVHRGGTCGAAVYAAGSGTVSYAGYNGGLGNNVQISHGGGVLTSYGHNTSLVVRYGQQVSAGQLIAYAGTTGNSTGCHVHFETRVNGTPQNPRPFMADRGVNF